MFGIDDAIMIPAAASLGGSLLGGAMDVFGGQQTNAANKDIANQANLASAQQAQNQMAFQERMSNTSYQRGIADMKAAGLNPMLAYANGGASAPTGAMAQITAPTMQNPYKGMGQTVNGAVQSAIGAANVKADLDLKEQQTIEAISRTNMNDEEAKLKGDQARLTRLQADKEAGITPQARKQLDLMDQYIITEKTIQGSNSASAAKTRQDIVAGQPGADHATLTYWMDRISQGTATAAQAIAALKLKGIQLPPSLDGKTPTKPTSSPGQRGSVKTPETIWNPATNRFEPYR